MYKLVDGLPRYKHPLYRVWRNMLTRCERDPDYKNVSICLRWEESFLNFVEDMGPSWIEGLTLDRKVNALGYTPENCRWATYAQQSQNRRQRSKHGDDNSKLSAPLT